MAAAAWGLPARHPQGGYRAGRVKIKNLPEVSVDRLTRKGLKQDKFALEVGHSVEFLGEHRKQVILYGSIGLVVLAMALGWFYYNRSQHANRQRELSAAMAIMNAPIGPAAVPGYVTFASVDLRNRSAVRALTNLATNSAGSEEGAIARYYLGTTAVGQGRLDEAVKHLSDAANSGNQVYASLAKLALADVYRVQNKTTDAEKLLRNLMDNPTIMVSKEQATITLARLLAPTKPEEARKLLEPLRSAPGAVGRAATAAYTEMAPAK
jgi:predicted negative regulator of RcsB-dependent stress response